MQHGSDRDVICDVSTEVPRFDLRFAMTGPTYRGAALQGAGGVISGPRHRGPGQTPARALQETAEAELRCRALHGQLARVYTRLRADRDLVVLLPPQRLEVLRVYLPGEAGPAAAGASS